MTLEELATRVPALAAMAHTEKIKLFGWWLHTHERKSHFRTKEIRDCYAALDLAQPVNASQQMDDLSRQKVMLKNTSGYRLERASKDELDRKYGQRQATVHVERLLTDLPQKVPNLKEKEYLKETLTCLRAGAFRATVVMAWNLAYDHLCYWILGDTRRHSDFNTAIPARFPKSSYSPVTKREDFFDMKESHVIDIASTAGVINKNVSQVLKEKLTRRNMAAHSGGVSTLQPTAEEVIRDLVENVVLKLA